MLLVFKKEFHKTYGEKQTHLTNVILADELALYVLQALLHTADLRSLNTDILPQTLQL